MMMMPSYDYLHNCYYETHSLYEHGYFANAGRKQTEDMKATEKNMHAKLNTKSGKREQNA